MAGANWEATILQIGLFTQKALPLTTDVFTAFVGEFPERQEDRPREGIRRQIGRFDEAELRTTITPVRVDFVFGPAEPTPASLLGGFSFSVGELRAELAKFERRVLAWLPKWEVATTRVSLVVRARARASSSVDAYRILQENLTSVNVRPGEMSDLIFRVNWRAKTSTIPEGYYNRISTWNAVKLTATAAAQGGPEVTVGEQDFADVEIDINTPADRVEPLPREKLGTIYGEFFQLALRLAEAGEGP